MTLDYNLHGVQELFPIVEELLCDFIYVQIGHVSVFLCLPLRKLQTE